jgi:MFS family permease
MFCIALSPNLEMVVGFRALQAVGTGCLYAASPAIAAEVFPARQRGLGMGFTAASQALGMLAGTLGAGFLVQWSGWEAVFLGRTPFTLAALILGVWFLRPQARRGSGIPFDLTGAVTLMAALLSLVIGLRLGRSAGWTSPTVLALLLLAPVFLAMFWRAECRAAWPVLPRELLRVRGFTVSSASMFLAHLGVFVIWFIFPFCISDGLGQSPLILGIMLALMASFNIGFSPAGGWLCDRAGTQRVGVAGLLILALGLLLMSFLGRGSSLFQVGLRISIVGAGLGLFQAAAYALMMNSVSAQRFGTASGALSLAQAFGRVLSVAIIGGIFALSGDYHLGEPATNGLALTGQGGQAFILAFQDVLRLGRVIVVLGAEVFLLSGLGRKNRPGVSNQDSGAADCHRQQP